VRDLRLAQQAELREAGGLPLCSLVFGEGISGQFVAPGVLDLAQGSTDGTYTAIICDGED
jgi:hypothetical protein